MQRTKLGALVVLQSRCVTDPLGCVCPWFAWPYLVVSMLNQGMSNQELSGERAKTVRDYLIDHGNVAADRLAACGFGEERPMKPNSSRENKKANRRSEFLVYG